MTHLSRLRFNNGILESRSKRDFNIFLGSIALGEYVASTDCKIFQDYFLTMGDTDTADLYKNIGLDERKHFRMIRRHITNTEILPGLLEIFRGSLLTNPECVIEKLLLMHLVFEPAAFTYCMTIKNSHELKYLVDCPDELHRDVQIIMKDEAKHMKAGYKAISLITADNMNSSRKIELSESVKRHLDALAVLPNQIFSSIPSSFKGMRENFVKSASEQLAKTMEINNEVR